jgi:general secretion pathway protein G
MNIKQTTTMKCNYSKNRNLKSQIRRLGFTLIELLLVLTILGILAAIVVPKIAGRSEDARKQAAVTQISAFKTALNTFEVDNGFYPKSLADLIQAPRDAQNWHGPYLESDVVPKDPWQHDFTYVCPGRHNTSSFDISSAGPDGQSGTEDDITSWTQKK